MKYKIVSTLTTSSFSVFYELEGHDINLSYNGDSTYKSTDYVEARIQIISAPLMVNG